MPVYFVAQLNIHDRDRYASYEAGFMDVFNRFGGRLLAVDESPETLEGSWDYTRTVVLSFDSESEAKAWYHSPEYQAIARHRFAASEGNVVLVKGLD